MKKIHVGALGEISGRRFEKKKSSDVLEGNTWEVVGEDPGYSYKNTKFNCLSTRWGPGIESYTWQTHKKTLVFSLVVK